MRPIGVNILKNVAIRNMRAAQHAPCGCARRALTPHCPRGARALETHMDEFGGGFLRNAMIGFALALALSIVYVWYTR